MITVTIMFQFEELSVGEGEHWRDARNEALEKLPDAYKGMALVARTSSAMGISCDVIQT